MSEPEPDVTSAAAIEAARRARTEADLRHAAEDAETGELSAEDLEWVLAIVQTRFSLPRGSVSGPKSDARVTPEQHAIAKSIAAVCIARQHGGEFRHEGMCWKGTLDGDLRATLP